MHAFYDSCQFLTVSFEFHPLQLSLPGHVNEVGFQEGEGENSNLLCMDDFEPLKSQ